MIFDPTLVTDAVDAFANFLLKYFVALAAVGALSMAIVEAVKKVFDLRTFFHIARIREWIDVDRSFLASQVSAFSGRMVGAEEAYAQLIHLTTGVDIDTAREAGVALLNQNSGRNWNVLKDAEIALFSLELERMTGQMQGAADAAISSPQRYASLYVFFASGADPKDVADWYDQADDASPVPEMGRDDPGRLKAAKTRADLYTRITQMARRKLDGFQLYTSYRWTNANQFWSILLGAAILVIILGIAQRGAGLAGLEFVKQWIFVAVCSLLGGMFAPVAKDIVSALTKVTSRG